jgi:thioredoxin 1
VLGPILKEVKVWRWNFHYKIDVDKTRNSIQVSGARYNDSFQGGKQLWRESGVLDKMPSLKSY